MKVTVEDIKNIPTNGILQVKLENNSACVSARNTVQYVKNVHPREDGKNYSVSTNWKTHTVTIKVVDP